MTEESIMKEQHLYTSDEKMKWFGYGEWVEEPDLVEFEHQGFKCEIIRIVQTTEHECFGGYLCGYVFIPQDHPWYEKNWREIDVEVHNGLNFTIFEKKYWVIGFDCAHSCDVVPSMIETRKEIKSKLGSKFSDLIGTLAHSPLFNSTYKNISFCIDECKSLAEQAKQAAEVNQIQINEIKNE